MAAFRWQFLQSTHKNVTRQKYEGKGELATEQVQQRMEMFRVQFDFQKTVSA
jgi:hypothetical protein